MGAANPLAAARRTADIARELRLGPLRIAAVLGDDVLPAVRAGDRAIADFTQALTLNPNYAQAYYHRAVAALFQKDYTKAWADVKRFQQAGGKPDPQFLRDLRKASGRQN